jgi:hypothetical protein
MSIDKSGVRISPLVLRPQMGLLYLPLMLTVSKWARKNKRYVWQNNNLNEKNEVLREVCSIATVAYHECHMNDPDTEQKMSETNWVSFDHGRSHILILSWLRKKWDRVTFKQNGYFDYSNADIHFIHLSVLIMHKIWGNGKDRRLWRQEKKNSIC